jgi:hypothetical protein
LKKIILRAPLFITIALLGNINHAFLGNMEIEAERTEKVS